jgi:hypothetical protein
MWIPWLILYLLATHLFPMIVQRNISVQEEIMLCYEYVAVIPPIVCNVPVDTSGSSSIEYTGPRTIRIEQPVIWHNKQKTFVIVVRRT